MTSHDYNTLTRLTESMDLLSPVRRIVTNSPPWISIQVAPFQRQNTWEVLNRLGWHGLLAYHFYPNWLPDSNGVEGGIFMNFPHQTMLMDGMMRCNVVWWECWQTKIRRERAKWTLLVLLHFVQLRINMPILFSLQHNVCCTSSEEGQRTVSNYAQKVLEDLAGVGSERVSDSVGEEPSSLEVTPNRGSVRESPSQILTIQV